MNRVHVRDFRRTDNAVNSKVAFRRLSLANANGFICELNMHRIRVRLRINGDGADVQFLTGADDPNGDFPAVGDQNFFKHGLSVKANRVQAGKPPFQDERTLKSGWPNSTGLPFSTKT